MEQGSQQQIAPANLWRRERGDIFGADPTFHDPVGGQSLSLLQALLKTVREFPKPTNEASVCAALEALKLLIEYDCTILLDREGC